MAEKHFTIDVEENTQENALFEDDKFVCFEGDTDEYLKKINEMSDEIEQLKQDLTEYCNFSLHDVLDKKNKEIERLQSTLAYRSNQLALMEQLIDDLGHEEMKRQMEEILND